MKITSNTNNIMELSLEIKKCVPNIEKIILFGSAARCDEMPKDIDILLLFGNNPDIDSLNDACNKIAKGRGYIFRIQNLLDYDTSDISASLDKSNFRGVHLLYSDKKELNTSQHPILDSIANEGVVFYSN